MEVDLFGNEIVANNEYQLELDILLDEPEYIKVTEGQLSLF